MATAKKSTKKTTVKKAAARKPAVRSKSDHSEGKWAAAFARAAGEKRYWLVKSEPDTFSFDDLLRAPQKTTGWDGVRNYVARNFLRDGMKKGDLVFFYHSSTGPQAIVGICEVVREGYPDATAFDPKHHGYDADSDRAEPRWFAVDVRAVEKLAHPVPLTAIKTRKELTQMALVRIGRLSVTPVTAKEWQTILGMASAGA